MFSSNANFERAEEFASRERQAGIKAASKALSGVGLADCTDCGCAIDPQRRAALPSARRCADCQETIERERSKR